MFARDVGGGESRLWTIDVPTGRKTLLTPAGETKVSYQAVGFARDGRAVYATSDEGGEFHRLIRLDLASGRRAVVAAFDWDVEDARLSHDRRRVAFTVNVDGASTLHVMELASGKERKLQRLPTGVVTGTATATSRRCWAGSARAPSSIRGGSSSPAAATVAT